MSEVVLVHGSWLDARCWAPVQERLSAAGISSIAPDLPGHGANAAAASLDAYVDEILSHCSASEGLVTLVGHSMAGTILTQAAERRPELFRKLIFVAAYLPLDGQSLNDLAQTDADSGIGPAMRPAPDWSTLDLAEESRRNLFFADVDAQFADPLLASWRAEPVPPVATPITRSDERFGAVDRFYVRTTADRVVSPALQSRMLAATPTRSIEIDSGHLPMLAKPDELSRIIVQEVRS